jgi:hypothetical protein
MPYSKDVSMYNYSIHSDQKAIATVTTRKREGKGKKLPISQNATKHHKPLHTANKVK